MRLSRHVRIEDDLGYPAAVAKVDEDDRTVVAPIGDPSEQHHLSVNVGHAQGATIMGALELIDESSQGIFLSDADKSERGS